MWLRGYPDGWNVLQPCHVSKGDIAGDDAMRFNQKLTVCDAYKHLAYNESTGAFLRRHKHVSRELSYINRGYIKFMVNGEIYFAHRVAWLMCYGVWPKNEIDHINGVRTDNRIVNLQESTRTGNSRNRGLGVNNKTKILGVSWANRRDKWESTIGVNSKKLTLYWGNDLFEACCARKSAEFKLKYSENHGRK